MQNRAGYFLVVLGLVTALGLFLRVVHLDHPMRYDESYNYLRFVIQGPSHIATTYLPNNHILHTLCVWSVSKLAGDSPAALRLPALLAGVLLVPATALLAWTLSRRKMAAILAALAVATSSPLIEYSANARGYSMLALWTVLAAYLVLSAVREPTRRLRWMFWGTAGAAGMYTVPVMALPLMGMGVFVVGAAWRAAARDDRAALFKGLALGTGLCVSLTALGYLPVVLAGGVKPFSQSQEMAYEILGQQVSSAAEMVAAAGALWLRHASPLLVILIVAGVAAYLLRATRDRDGSRWVLPLILGISVLAASAVSAPLPARTWMFALPLVLVMVACGLSELVPFPKGSSCNLGGTVSQREAVNLLPWPAPAGQTMPHGSRTTLLKLALPSRERALVRVWIERGVQGALAVLLLLAGTRVWESETLVSEPGGLVLIEPALKECQAFGTDRCAVVAPYSPATVYYQSRLGLSQRTEPGSEAAQRVLILTNDERSLDELWRPGVAGYEHFSEPELVWRRSGGSLYLAERAARNALR